jgi:uncharacterized protein (DUF1778 family)
MIKTRRRRTIGQNGRASSGKAARLEARISEQQKALIERAAAYEGRSVTDFVVHAVSEAAMTVVQARELLRLNQAQSRAFVKRLLEPSEPNAALRAAARKYRRSVAKR